MKSCTLTRSGWPRGSHSRPPFLNWPTSSFFLVSTLITGSPVDDVVAGLVVEIAELGVAIGMGGKPSIVLALACRLNPNSALSSLATVGTDTRCPAAASSATISRRVDFVVHRNGDSGSPRDPGSTNPSRAAPKPGSVCVTGLRPPPGLRVQPSNGFPPASSSSTPTASNGHRAVPRPPRATVLIPPWPSDRCFRAHQQPPLPAHPNAEAAQRTWPPTPPRYNLSRPQSSYPSMAGQRSKVNDLFINEPLSGCARKFVGGQVQAVGSPR